MGKKILKKIILFLFKEEVSKATCTIVPAQNFKVSHTELVELRGQYITKLNFDYDKDNIERSIQYGVNQAKLELLKELKKYIAVNVSNEINCKEGFTQHVVTLSINVEKK